MDFRKFQEWTKTKAQTGMKPYDFASNMAMGLKETSEVIGEYKKTVFRKHEFDKVKFVKELGEFGYYFSEVANIWDIDLQLIWDGVKAYAAINMHGVSSNLTDLENKTIDELISLDKSAADLALIIRNRDNWRHRKKQNAIQLVRVLTHSIAESLKTILHIHDITLKQVLDTNVQKLNKRFPNGFSSEDSIKRVDTKNNGYECYHCGGVVNCPDCGERVSSDNFPGCCKPYTSDNFTMTADPIEGKLGLKLFFVCQGCNKGAKSE
jgi:hypothetical protein